MRFFSFLFFAITLVALSGCAQTELASHWIKMSTSGGASNQPIVTASDSYGPSKSQGAFKVGKPYRVSGIWYTPVESYSYDETGIASWYGPKFHGKKTANGERFDQNALTAAHPTLQMPSLIKVTNLSNGRSVVLRVNDRGPFKRGRILDVSKRGAELLGFKGQGTAKVRVQVLDIESQAMANAAKQGQPLKLQMAAAQAANKSGGLLSRKQEPPQVIAGTQRAQPSVSSQPAAMPPRVITGHNENNNFIPDPIVTKEPVQTNNIFIQIGSFSNPQNAFQLSSRIAYLGNANVYPTVINGQQYNRVRVGPIASVDMADAILNRAIDDGFSGAHIVVD